MNSEDDADSFPVIEMPFPPTIGMNIRIPWCQMDYLEVDALYWDDAKQEYLAYFK